MPETNNMQDVYCTQPKKVNGLWVMNVHIYGKTLGVAQFKTKQKALMFKDELDNWVLHSLKQNRKLLCLRMS